MKELLLALAIFLNFSLRGQYFEKHEVYDGVALTPTNFTEFDGHLYYLGDQGGFFSASSLYKTNGTVGDIEVLLNEEGDEFNVLHILGAFDERIYFYGEDSDQEREVFSVGTSMDDLIQITDLNQPYDPNLFVLNAFGMREVNGTLTFAINDEQEGGVGVELWTTDGSELGAMPFLDINPNGDGFGSWLGELNDWHYFSANDGVHGTELWRTNGTPEGTSMVKDITANGTTTFFNSIEFDNRIFFAAYDITS